MNRIDNPVPCPCRRPGAYARYTDELEVGLTEDCWDITRTTCTCCGTTWLRAPTSSTSGSPAQAATTVHPSTRIGS